jgi:hypothetical protein
VDTGVSVFVCMYRFWSGCSYGCAERGDNHTLTYTKVTMGGDLWLCWKGLQVI